MGKSSMVHMCIVGFQMPVIYDKDKALAMTLALGYNGSEAAIWVDGSQVGACSMARPVYCVRER